VDDVVLQVNELVGLSANLGVERCLVFESGFFQDGRQKGAQLLLHFLNLLVPRCFNRVPLLGWGLGCARGFGRGGCLGDFDHRRGLKGLENLRHSYNP